MGKIYERKSFKNFFVEVAKTYYENIKRSPPVICTGGDFYYWVIY